MSSGSVFERYAKMLAQVANLAPTDGWADEWERFYMEVFGSRADFSKVNIPEDPGGFGWVVIVAKGLTLNRAWAKCQDRFPSYSDCGDDLDEHMDKHTPSENYARRLRNRVEADVENKTLSANNLAEQKIQCITLLERLLLELWYHWKTGGGHLDLLSITLCAGSRCRNGDFPAVSWSDSRFKLEDDYPPSVACGGVCARSVV